ncbi:putative DNA repair protein Rad18 [Glonium stellatum]|uniref:Putative DNA repair protein Rad18 n=1 Tax=Glonium stellatum TaxID=574774 RepID=A0A8E2ENM1_9PEZI|nr:putative DNA repair protein Rad18 [Glonium stellatum]
MAPMSSAKRPRARTEESIYEIHTASSNLRRDRSKRARLSTETEDGETETVMSDASEEPERENYREASAIEDYATRRDAGFEDLQYQEADDQRATQIVKKRFKEDKENSPADNAIIEEIKCVNFMCHDKLSVKLGPLINFIIGHNGSGKSAVLTAVTLCLGGKATATNRGQSLKNFIKEGRESAMLSVQLKNQGSSAYKPEIYGKSIIVERHFSKSGASGFKIKNAKDKIISIRKSDLEDITDAFALQLDNPMNVLTQDMARQFLNHSSPQDKYKFFVKGTQLEALDHDYRLMQESIDRIESHISTRREEKDKYFKTYEEAQKRLERAENLRGIQEKINKYRRQMAWSQVIAEERELNQIDTRIQQADERIAQTTLEAEEASRLYENADQACTAAQAALQELQSALVPLEEDCKVAKDQFELNKKELMTTLSQQRQIQEAIRGSDKQITGFRKDITEERQRQERANGGQHAQKLTDIQDAKAKAEEIKLEIESHGQELQGLERELRDADEALKRMRSTIAEKRDNVRKSEGLIQNLTRDQGNWVTAYHPNLSKLLNAIQNERRFKHQPVGPMGRHIRLLKPEWSSILERQFGSALNAFVVTNKTDQGLLSDLMQKTKCFSSIFIGDMTPIDTRRNEPDSGLDTSMRVLKIDNDLVRNQLIISQGIEQTVLIRDRNAAMEFMYGGTRPANVKMCFCMHDTKRGWGLALQYSSGGSERSSPVHPWGARLRMQTDFEYQIKIENETLAHYKRELDEADSNLRELQDKHQKCDQAIHRHRRQSKDLRLRHQRAEELAEQLKDELEAETPQAGQIDALERLLREAEEGKQISENARLKKQLEALQAEVKETKARINKADGKVRALVEKRQAKLFEKNAAFECIQDAKLDKARHQQIREEQVAKIDEYVQMASQISARVPVDANESYESLEKKYEKLGRDLRNGERELGGTQEELSAACIDARYHYKKAVNEVKHLDDLVHGLKTSMIDRQDRWLKFRRFISSRARITFTYLLSERNFRGHLEISPMAKFLDIKVEPDITKSSDKGRQTKTLSGGEKSFSTICLLLALWDAMGSPIRCLDEFDVFMDNVNRDISMKMMIGAARRSVGRQFILITPQAMGNVTLSDDVKIIKMSDPERGQTTLPFAR